MLSSSHFDPERTFLCVTDGTDDPNGLRYVRNFNALLSRALEIGAKDLVEEPVVATTDVADEIGF